MIDETRILVTESVMVLPPDMRGEQVVQRRDGPAPGNASSDLQPLGVLIEHGIHDVDKGFIAVEQTMAPSEQVTFQPSLAEMFTEDFHYAPVGRKILISGFRPEPDFSRCFIESSEPIRGVLVRSEYAEVLGPSIQFHH